MAHQDAPGDRLTYTTGLGPRAATPFLPIGLPLFLTASAGAIWLSFRLRTGIVLEDALITFRHAENLAAGLGYGFNAGEWVQGSTTPVLTLVLAAVAFVFGGNAIPTAAVVIGIAAGCATVLLTHDVFVHWGFSPAVRVGALLGWMTTPCVVWSTVGGMETPLVACGMALSVWAIQRGAGAWLGAAIALLLLTRPDTLLWCVLLVAAVGRNRDLWLRAAPFAIPVLAWLVFATWAFGTPVPHSLLAKSVVNPRMGSVWDLAKLVSRLTWLAEAWRAPWPGWGLAGWALSAGGVVVTLRAGLRSTRVGAALALVYVVLFALASHIGRSPPFLWYPVPSAWAAAVLGGVALQALAQSDRVGLKAGGVVVAAIWLSSVAHLRGVVTEWSEVQQNELRFRAAAGQWIAQNTAVDAVVAMEAIGYQGTHAQRRIVDLAGLISPEVLEIARETPNNAKRFDRMLERFQPDVVLLRAYEVKENKHFHGGRLFADAKSNRRFEAKYREGARFVAPHPKDNHNHEVVVYVRHPRD